MHIILAVVQQMLSFKNAYNKKTGYNWFIRQFVTRMFLV